MVKQRILVADDEEDVLNLVAMNLSGAGFQVVTTEDGSSAVDLAKRQTPALIVLDLMMPGMSGLEVCKALKNDGETAGIPIILLTARSTEVDRVLAFELGADDYVTKPFSPRELTLRVQAILRRRQRPLQSGETCLVVGGIRLDLDRHDVTVNSKHVDLTAIEFKLLTALMERQGRAQSRDVLLTTVWGLDREIELRTVDTHLRRLRDKLGLAGEQIHTVRGFGYRLDEA
jgi:two-component system phosphate regulon response regulator PhoB